MVVSELRVFFATKRGKKLIEGCIGQNKTGKANLKRIARSSHRTTACDGTMPVSLIFDRGH